MKRELRGTNALIVATLFILCLGFLPMASAGAFTRSSQSGPSAVPAFGGGGVDAQNVDAQTNENTPVAIDVLSGDSVMGLGSDPLHVQSVTQPPDGAATINSNNTVTYSPDANFYGSDSFQYTAADETGLFTGTGTVYVTVNAGSTTTSATSATTTSATSTTTTSATSATTSTSSTTTTSSSTTTSTTTSTSAGGTSQLTVNTELNGGGTATGFYVVLSQNNVTVATGYSPAQFTVNDGQTYVVGVDDYSPYYFQYWQDTGSVNSNSTLATSSNLSLTAVMCDGPPGTCTDPTPADGITVYAHRISASYWAPCFATACSAGTGPGATMFFELLDSSGNVVQTGYANEQGYTFTGLTPGASYYVYAEDCDLCHGSTHDVVFDYWGDDTSTTNPIAATVGTSLDAWFSCTNGCSGG